MTWDQAFVPLISVLLVPFVAVYGGLWLLRALWKAGADRDD